MTDQTSVNSQLPTPDTHPLIFRLAKQLGKPLSFYDIETTGLGYKKPTFGITEFAFLAILPEGKAKAHAKLLNPQNIIEQAASDVTGITQDMVDHLPSFGDHADKVIKMMEHTIMVGFHCDLFDTPALLSQIERYGIEKPSEWHSVDLRTIWVTTQNTKKGKLVEIAEHYGVPFKGAHRAYADCAALADILEQMIWKHGIDVFTKSIRMNWEGASSSAEDDSKSKQKTKSNELSEKALILKEVLDKAFEAKIKIEDFVKNVKEKGFTLEVTRYGGARYFHEKGTEKEEKISGSDLGKGYTWKDVTSKLKGDVPEDLKESETKKDTSKGSSSERASNENKAIQAILVELASGCEKLNIEKIIIESGAGAKAVSFALSNLLKEERIKPDHVINEIAQSWLDSHWSELPTEGRLIPWLEKCREMKCPAEIDFLQLHVAKAMRARSAQEVELKSSAEKDSEITSIHKGFLNENAMENIQGDRSNKKPLM